MADSNCAPSTIRSNGEAGPSSRVSLRRDSATPSLNATSQSGKRKAGGKSAGPEWQFASNISRFVEWKCNLCGLSKSGGAPRIREHLLGGNSRIKGGKCKGVGADEAAKRLTALLGRMPSNKRQAISKVNGQTPSPMLSSGDTTARDETPVAEVTMEMGASPEFQVGTSKTRQVNLVNSFRATALEDAQLALAKAIYFTGSSLSMVTKDPWKNAWKKIGEYGAGFTPPTYHHMRNQLLDKCFNNTQESVQRLIVNAADQSGCTVVSDGWSNVQKRPLINVMLVCPRGECFIKAVDSSGEIKSGQFIANIISEAIDQVGAQNVVQVIMDNAANCRAAGRLLEDQYPNIYTFGCNTHSLNLVLQDWYKSSDTEWFKTIIDNARKIVKFVLKRQRVLDMYRQRMETMLKLPCDTRFCTNFYMVQSLLRNKNAVMETFVCAHFSEWEATQPQAVKGKVLYIRSLLSDREFWDEATDCYHVMMPVMLALRQLDSRLPNIGKVWMAWWSIQESLTNPEEPAKTVVKQWSPPFSRVRRNILAKYVSARWVGAHSPLHSVAYCLDPEYWAMDINQMDEEVIDDFYDVVERFYEDSDEQAAAVTELTKYKLKEGRFASEFVQKLAKEQPAWKWWMLNGGSAPTLRRLAVKVLAQCASNSSSERNWSSYKYVHSTVRNRLLSSRAEKLVYMYCNDKLIKKIEADDYNETMPKWTYDLSMDDGDMDSGPDAEEEFVYASQNVCSVQEIEENLQPEYGLSRATKRRSSRFNA